jgi:tripeptidyl-peptidase-1
MILLGLLLVSSVYSEVIRTNTRYHCAFNSPNGCQNNFDWKKISRASPSDSHTVIIAVKLQDDAAAACDSLIYSTLNASSHFSLEKVNQIFSSRENINKVESFLSSKGFSFRTVGDFIQVTSKVSDLENLLQAEYYNFQSQSTKTKISRTYSFQIPSEIENHVDFISNTVTFPNAKLHVITNPLHKRQSGSVIPSVINQVYGVKSNKVATPKATQALFEALGQQYSPDDLTSFQQAYNLPTQKISKVVGTDDGSQCSWNPNACAEANLDVQYMMAVAQNSPTWFWSIDQSAQDPFLDWVVALSTTSNAPLIHSISYGSIATEDSRKDMTRFNTEICKLGLRGITVFVASGDDGVANFEARGNPSACGFNPSFPATSPYVTSVGATQGPESGSAEIACSSATGGVVTTGGGFSIAFDRPAYQESVVSNYLKNGPNVPPTSQFNSKGRAYPDVALLGFNYEVYIGGSAYGVSGTSASTPTFAGMMTLVNGARLNAGKKSLGFLNPTLYKLASTNKQAFRDVTSGENNCCAAQSNPTCCQYGFTASAGWDPLTGLGSPNFPVLASALLKA